MELQAFIFCGKGHSLAPFTNPSVGQSGLNTAGTTSIAIPDSNRLPKALLPIANRPMIEYVIDWCDQGDFKEINIVAHTEEIDLIKAGLKQFLAFRKQQFELISKSLLATNHTHHLQAPKKVNFIASKTGTTGESLQTELLGKIKGDFVLLPCDFITDIPPQILIDQYQNRDDDNLAMAVYYKNMLETTIDKKQLNKQQTFTVYSENEDSDKQPVLLDVYTKENVSKTKYLQIRSHLLWKYPNTTVSTKLHNSFIYFCSYELCELLTEAGDSASRAITDSEPEEEEEEKENQLDATRIYPSYFRKSNKLIHDHINTKTSLSKIFRDLARRSWQHSKKRETVGIFILPEPGVATFIRANSLATYMDATRYILRVKSTTSSLMTSSSAIGADSIVDPSCKILEKSSIKLSVVSGNTTIGNKCRISGSVLLSGVEVDDECILENVIVGPAAKIGKKSKLTNCYVEGHYVVNLRSMFKGETLARSYLDGGEGEDVSSDNTYSSEDDSDGTDDYDEEYYDDEDFEDDGLFER